MIRRDRNHPCVVMWSTGNEVREQLSIPGHAISQRLTDIAHDEDPSRFVSAGCSKAETGFNGFQKTVDVFGYNYKPHLYGEFRTKNPNQNHIMIIKISLMLILYKCKFSSFHNT